MRARGRRGNVHQHASVQREVLERLRFDDLPQAHMTLDLTLSVSEKHESAAVTGAGGTLKTQDVLAMPAQSLARVLCGWNARGHEEPTRS
jgi:hypothetical protein